MIDIYAPNLNHIFETFDIMYQQEVTTEADDYLTSLLVLGILVPVDGKYEAGKEWLLMQWSGSRRTKAFKKQMLSLVIPQKILETIGNDGKFSEDVEHVLNATATPATVRTFLSWMEILNVLRLTEQRYVLSDEEEEEDESTDYPTLDDAVNITDDKNSIFEYIRRLREGRIILSPDFQRHVVWKPEQKSRFIESVLMGLPLPPIYLKKDSSTRYLVVDGLQRTSTLCDFMEGELTLSGLEPEGRNVLEGATIDTLDNIKEGLKAQFEDRQLFIYVMEPSVPMSVVYDVFNRINTGGTQLSRQEIRNCIFQGNSTRLLKSLAESSTFKDAIGCGILDLRMKDREAVLRCLAFAVQNYELDYDGSMDKYMEKAMTKINKMRFEDVEALKNRALEVFATTERIFGAANFRIPTDYTRGRINIAVMETVFHCFYQADKEPLNNQLLQDAFDTLLKTDSFLGAVRWSTGSTSQVKARFRMAHNVFDKLLKI